MSLGSFYGSLVIFPSISTDVGSNQVSVKYPYKNLATMQCAVKSHDKFTRKLLSDTSVDSLGNRNAPSVLLDFLVVKDVDYCMGYLEGKVPL